MFALELQYLIYPIAEFGDARVNARLIGLRTANAPRDDAAQLEAFVIFALQHHRTARVTFLHKKKKNYHF